MLMMKRKRGDVIKIGNDIEITIIETGRESVRLGLKASPEVRITHTTENPMQQRPQHQYDERRPR